MTDPREEMFSNRAKSVPALAFIASYTIRFTLMSTKLRACTVSHFRRAITVATMCDLF